MGLQAGAVKAKHRATVIMYKKEKGFGFLAVEGYPHDLFVHGSAVRAAGIDTADLLPRVKVLCNVGKAPDGRDIAVDLELVPTA